MRAIRLSSMRTTTYQSPRLSLLSCITERSGACRGGDMVAACMGNVKNSGGAAVSVAV